MRLTDLTESQDLIKVNKYKRLARQAKEHGDEVAYRKYTDLAARSLGSYASHNRGMKVREQTDQGNTYVHVRMDDLDKSTHRNVVNILKDYEKLGIISYDSNTDKGVIFKLNQPSAQSALKNALRKYYVTADITNVSEEEEVDEGKGLLRGIAAALGLSAAMWAAMPSAVDTPLGKAMAVAAEQGDPVAAKYLKHLDFYADEDPATLKMLGDKYLHGKNRNTDR